MSADRRLSSTGASAARIARANRRTQQEGTTEEEGNDAARNSPHPCGSKHGIESVWPLRERLYGVCVSGCFTSPQVLRSRHSSAAAPSSGNLVKQQFSQGTGQ